MLGEIPEFRALPRVTSDCLPFRAGGRLLTCPACGAAQARADEQWLSEIGEIYRSYYAYHQSDGIEQCVSDPATGQLSPRSEVLVGRLLHLDGAPPGGKVLDVGCGTGATLRAFAQRDGWRLCGLELDDRNLRFLSPLRNFDRLYTCSPAEVPEQFTLITLVHALEHFPDPLPVLQSLSGKIAPGGRLFVEVPNAEANPFDYVIADHMTHFSPATLAVLLERAGFEVEVLATDWVAKELSLVARLRGSGETAAAPANGGDTRPGVMARIEWLSGLLQWAREAGSEDRPLGLFGSSIAATWLCGALGPRISFFVDEDPNRAGRRHLDRPILAPSQAPDGSIVLLAMAPQPAIRIAERLRSCAIDLRLPPPL
jgi:2-polyprenyl-3-methyl-5-hydroxy-6-metoxy-1,4-benzoquinol methylase